MIKPNFPNLQEVKKLGLRVSSELKRLFKSIIANYESQNLQCTMVKIKIHTLGKFTILESG